MAKTSREQQTRVKHPPLDSVLVKTPKDKDEKVYEWRRSPDPPNSMRALDSKHAGVSLKGYKQKTP